MCECLCLHVCVIVFVCVIERGESVFAYLGFEYSLDMISKLFITNMFFEYDYNRFNL